MVTFDLKAWLARQMAPGGIAYAGEPATGEGLMLVGAAGEASGAVATAPQGGAAGGAGGRPKGSGGHGQRAGRQATDDDQRLRRARAYIDLFSPAVSGQNGHAQTFDAACALVKGFGLSAAEARPILQAYSARCQPPWSDAEIDHKLADADARPDDKPRGYLLGAPGRNRGPGAVPDWDEIGDLGAAERGAAQAEAREFANFTEEFRETDDGETKAHKVPRRPGELVQALGLIAGHWPKRVDETLFWESSDHEPVYLDSTTRLFAWISRWSQMNWLRGPQFVTQEQFYEHLRMTAEPYEAIETLPHWPKLPGIYYMHKPFPTEGDGTGRLNDFLSFFNPNTGEDRELIKALILTLFWGGMPGKRPAFLITGPDRDQKQGRGVGKTTLVDIIADELLGGAIDVAPTDAIADVKTRLLSDTARQTRVARLDNVKTLKFSWADLEGLITASEISGRQLYKGEGRRPNTLIWCITLNGASLSKDMAQRIIPIKLRRPTFRAEWEAEVRAFAREYRWEIIRDVGTLLECEPGPIAPQTRWSTWEKQVLSKTDLPESCQQIIIDQQGSLDDDDDERDLVTEKFRDEIRTRNHDPDKVRVFIPSLLAAQWLNEVAQTKHPTNRASAHLAGLGISELNKKSFNAMRGWIWLGEEARLRMKIIDLSGKLNDEQMDE